MKTWIFQGNPNEFDIDGYLDAGLDEITWLVSKYSRDIEIGDTVYIWRSSGSDKDKAGIVGKATVITQPADIEDDEAAAPFWINNAPAGLSTRVRLNLHQVANSRKRIKREWLKDDPACSGMLILRQPAGTNFPLTESETIRLNDLWAKTGAAWSREESLAALHTYLRLYGSQISRTPNSPVADLAILIGRAVTGAYNKLMNFRAIDPRDTRDGMSGASSVDRAVWAEFFDDETQTIDQDAVSEEFQRIWGNAWIEPTSERQNDLLQQSVEREKDSLQNLADRLLASDKPKKPRAGTTLTTVFDRDPVVIAYAKERAAYKCEIPGCDYTLFTKPNGEPYLEVHHIETLRDGGEDTTQNVACLCPSHHREIHSGALFQQLEEALRELRASERH